MWKSQPHRSALTALVLMTVYFSAHSEHLLVKTNGSEYVGLQISEKLFQACGNRTVQIEGGTVSNTVRKCPKPPTLTGLLPGVVVEEVDASSRTFKAQVPDMGTKKFYFPEVSESMAAYVVGFEVPQGHAEYKVWFSTLKPGDKLKVNAWKAARDQNPQDVWVTEDVRSDKPGM